jgi:RNA polymerase sigma-70 factor (ECF subfamily)
MITTAAQTVLRKHGVGRPSDVPEQYWELVEKYRSELVAQATSILGSAEDAEDVVQETFCEAVRNPEKLTQAGSIGAWLRSINRCNALNRVRDNRRSTNKAESKRLQAPDKALTTGGFSALELRETLSKALDTLPPTMKSVIEMRYFEQLSYKEIADRLGMPIGNVGGLLLDASVRLYAKLKEGQEKKS